MHINGLPLYLLWNLNLLTISWWLYSYIDLLWRRNENRHLYLLFYNCNSFHLCVFMDRFGFIDLIYFFCQLVYVFEETTTSNTKEATAPNNRVGYDILGSAGITPVVRVLFIRWLTLTIGTLVFCSIELYSLTSFIPYHLIILVCKCLTDR